MAENPAWVKLAMRMDGQGGASPFLLSEGLPEQPLGEGTPEEAGVLWLNLDYTFDETRQWLLAQPMIPETVSDALIAEDTRPRAAEVGGGLLVYLRGVNLYPDARPEDMIAVRLWIKGNLLISSQNRQLLSLSEIGDDLLNDQGPVNAWQWLARLVDATTWRTEGVIGRIEDLVGQCSDALEQSPDRSLTHTISSMRRRAISLRRHLSPQREAISRLQANPHFEHGDAELIREAGERLQRLIEDLDAARDQATLLQEEVFAIQNEITNDRMYFLAAVSAVFLPLSFLTGLFGINIGGMPGINDPHAFWWFVAALLVITLAILLRMAQLRWFGGRIGKAVRLGRLSALLGDRQDDDPGEKQH